MTQQQGLAGLPPLELGHAALQTWQLLQPIQLLLLLLPQRHTHLEAVLRAHKQGGKSSKHRGQAMAAGQGIYVRSVEAWPCAPMACKP